MRDHWELCTVTGQKTRDKKMRNSSPVDFRQATRYIAKTVPDRRLYTVSQKIRHYTHVRNFVKC